MRRALQALEAQQRRLGGTAEQLGEFRAQHLDIYRDLVDLLLEEGMAEEAFGVLESGRARAFLAMVAERDVVAHDVPAELELRRRLANAEHDRTMAALGKLGEADEEERLRLLAALEAIRQRQDEIRAGVRSVSSRLAALRYPEPLDLASTWQALEPGTLLLEYSLGKETGHLFVVGPGPGRFAVYPLAIGEEALREDVLRLRRLVARGQVESGFASGTANWEGLAELSRTLYTTLLAPARTEIQGTLRLVISPDGPLHLLPFAALVDASTGADRYLVEARPLTVVASATVMVQLRQLRAKERGMRLVAFGDPRYPGAAVALEPAGRGGLRLDPLPASRQEVEQLGRLLGDSVTLWLGDDATEERAKTVDGRTTAVHFATHGFVDEQRPLSSALALTIPEQAREWHRTASSRRGRFSSRCISTPT